MKKRWMFLALALLVLAGIAGCGRSGDGENGEYVLYFLASSVEKHGPALKTEPYAGEEPAEPGVAQFAASHFGGNTMLAFVGRYIEVRYNALHAKVAAKSRDKVLIAHRFLATEVEIAVSHRAAVSKLQHHTQQHHRVGTTAHSHKISLIGRQNVM